MSLVEDLRSYIEPDDTMEDHEAIRALMIRAADRIDELLVTIRNLSASTPYPEEAGSSATLIAEVGSLKARIAELERSMSASATHKRW